MTFMVTLFHRKGYFRNTWTVHVFLTHGSKDVKVGKQFVRMAIDFKIFVLNALWNVDALRGVSLHKISNTFIKTTLMLLN